MIAKHVLSLNALFGEDAAILRETKFQFLLLSTTLPVLGTAMLSPVLDSLIGPFGTTAANIGLMISVFTAPAIVMIPVAGMLADRYGRKRVLVAAVCLFGAAGTAIAFTADFRAALFLRALQGIAFAGINPIIITSIGDIYGDEREATGQGIRQMVSGLSGAVSPLLAGFLVLFAWQYPFLLFGLAFPLAVGLYLWFEEPTSSTVEGADRDNLKSYIFSIIRLLGYPRVLAMVIGRSLYNVIWLGFLTYNSLIVVRLMGGTPVEAGVLATVGFMTFALTAGQAGRIASVFGSRYALLAVANVGFGLGFIVLLFAPGLVVATIGIAVSGAGFGVIAPLYRDVITGLAPTELRAGLVGLAESGGRITSTLTPLAMGGVIAVASPAMGFPPALRLAGLGVALIGSGGGIAFLVVAQLSGPAPGETV